MTTSLAVIDAGFGNLHSVQGALQSQSIAFDFVSEPDQLEKYSHVILPGVGAFASGMKALQSLGLDKALQNHVKSGKPLLGICLGMQFLFESSHEDGVTAGLGFVSGSVQPIRIPGAKVPHMGWNDLQIQKPSLGLSSGDHVYFVHSFHCVCDDQDDVCAYVDYEGRKLTVMVHKDNVWGCQFHPEKSGVSGLRVFQEFSKI